MSVSRLVTPRAAKSWSSYRSQISQLYVVRCISLMRDYKKAPFPQMGGASSLAFSTGKRLMSTAEKFEDHEEVEKLLGQKILYQERRHETVFLEDQRHTSTGEQFVCKEDRLRSKGYAIIPSKGARNRWPFLVFGNFFLRENCQCSKCVHPDTMQRISDTFSIPLDVNVCAVSSDFKGSKVTWSDGHESFYTWEWLIAHQQNRTPYIKWWVNERLEPAPLRPYNAYQPEHDEYPKVSYEDVMANDTAVLDWLEKIYQRGFCFIRGVPVDPESTKALIERIAHIRHTHYGGFWDFTADLTFKDTAYTNEFLGAHTDNTYFTDPARLQLFHLLSHTDGAGGASLLVDGFAAARQLLKKNQHHYRALVKERHPWHASGNENACIQPSVRAPVLSLHQDMGTVYQLRWNNYDRAPKCDWRLGAQRLWYEAAFHFNAILNQEKRQIWTQLEPGTALIFDNWRMLHGRSKFTGKRRMCGGYVNNDDFISRFRLLKFGRDKVLKNLGNAWDAHTIDNPYSIY